jgi:hypothetical protein
MSATTFNKLSKAIKESGLHAEPIRVALDEHLGTGKVDPKRLAVLAFEMGTRTKAKGGAAITDPELLLQGIAAKSTIVAAELRNRMQ